MQAAGAYLRTLRKLADKNQTEVADAIGVDIRTIVRWEKGENIPYGHNLLSLLALIDGDQEDFEALLNNPAATMLDGERVAREAAPSSDPRVRLTRLHEVQLNEVIDEMGADEVLRILNELKRNPKLLERWVWFGKGLAAQDE